MAFRGPLLGMFQSKGSKRSDSRRFISVTQVARDLGFVRGKKRREERSMDDKRISYDYYYSLDTYACIIWIKMILV
jgi:hypothetical protein